MKSLDITWILCYYPATPPKYKKYANDGFFNISQDSNHDVDNDVVSIDSLMNSMDDDDNDVKNDD